MPKRQDAQINFSSPILMLMTGLVLILVGACQPTAITPEQTSSPTKSNVPSPTASVDTIAQPSASITSTPDCRQRGGDLQEHRYFSDLLEKDIKYFVYLPPCYSETTQKRFPVLYLLHGLSYSKDQWLRLGLVHRMDTLIARGEIEPFIIILPEESPSEPPQVSLFPDTLTQELIPWIDFQYATLSEKSFRSIGGISRGAAWAVQIGFEFPSLFCCVGAHSLPLFQADGGKITRWLTQVPVNELPRVFIDIGRDDQEWPTAQKFAKQLDAAHIPHEWYLFRYGHTEAYWSSHLDMYLRWYAKSW